MQPDVSRNYMFLSTAREIWEVAKQTYSKVQDVSVIYEVKTKISSTKQGGMTVTEYYNSMNGLWLELDQYQKIKMVCSANAATLNKIMERDRIVEFLAGLNSVFDQVRVQILGREKLPSLNEVFAMVRSEENRRAVMLQGVFTDGSALVSNKGEGSRQRGGKSGTQGRPNNREGLWCTYCKKPRHTRDNCFKLHGKEAVLSKLGGFPSTTTRPNTSNQSYLSHKGQEEDGTMEKLEENFSSDLTLLNSEEINKLKSFLKTIQDDGSCSLAHQDLSGKPSGKFAYSVIFPASNTDRNDTWILDSGATDHMTPNSHVFTTYQPLKTTKQICIANGKTVPIIGHGSVYLSPNITLNHVLHVPQLSDNLLSISQLTRNLHCHAVFSSNVCEFQAMKTRRRIGAARETNGLYCLTGKAQKNQQPVACSSQITANYHQIWLHHYRLGHPPFSLLKSMFPTLFLSLDPSTFHCDVCVISKQHRVSYPISNKLHSIPFALIHSDVWGPCKIPTYSGARWFISFIDDCTRMTWVFLLKDKAAIQTVLPNFCKMITTQFGTPIKKFRTDNARDYFNSYMNHFFLQEGIIHESSCVDTPQQNGVAERKMRHLLNVARALLHHHTVPKIFWGEAVLTAAFLINRMPTKVLNQQSPLSCLTTHFPDSNFHTTLPLRVFG